MLYKLFKKFQYNDLKYLNNLEINEIINYKLKNLKLPI